MRFLKVRRACRSTVGILALGGAAVCAQDAVVEGEVKGLAGYGGGAELVQPFIVGGEDVPEGERSYQVMLLGGTDERPEYLCSGALINAMWVLTAAHCVDRRTPDTYRVRLGSSNLENYAVSIPLLSQIIHPEWDRENLHNDIALLRLASPAPESIQPVELAPAWLMEEATSPGALVTFSGWGRVESNGLLASQLQAVELPVVSNEDCDQAYGMEIQDSMFCAGFREGGMGACNGDSGSPVTVNYYGQDFAVGIASFISDQGCGAAESYTGSTRAVSFTEWIQQYLTRANCAWAYQTEVPYAWGHVRVQTPVGACRESYREEYVNAAGRVLGVRYQ